MEPMIGWFVIFFALSSVVGAFPEDLQPQEYQHEHPDEFTDEHRRHSYRPHRDQPEKSNERDDDEGYDRRRGEYQTVAPHRHRTYKHHRRHRHPHPQPQPDLAEEMVESTEASYQTEATEQHAEESNSNQMAANIAQTKSLEPDTFDDESTDPVEAEAKLGWPEWIMMVFLRGKTFVQNVWEGGKAVGNAAVTGGKAVGNAAVTGGKAVGNAAVAVGDAAKTVYGWMRCGANGVVRAYRVINHWYDLPEGTSPNPTDMSPTTSSSDSSDALNSDVRGLIVPPFESTISLVPPVTQETTTENPESQESREIYSKEQSQFTTTLPPDPSTHPAYEKQSAHEDPPKHHPYYETKSPEEQLEDTSHPISPSIHDYNQKPRSYDNQDPPRHHSYYQTSEEQPEYTTPPSPSMHEYYRKPRSSEDPGIQDDDSQFENNDRPIHHDYHGQGDRRVFHYHHHYHHHQQPDYDSSIHKHHRIDPNPVDPSIDHYRTKPVDDSSNSESQEEPTRHKYRPKSEDQDPALIHKQHRQLNDIDPNQDDPPNQHRNPVDDDSPESGEVPYRHSTTEAYEPSIHHVYSGPNDPYVHHYHPNPSSEEDDDQPINHKYRTTTEPYNPSIHHAYSGPNDPYVHHYHPKSSSEEDYDRPIKHKYRTTTEPNDPYVHHLIPNPENDPSTQNYNSNSNNPFVHQYHPQPGDDSGNSEAGTDSSESSTQVFRKQMFGSGNTFVVCILFFCFGI